MKNPFDPFNVHFDTYIKPFAERGYDSILLNHPVISYASNFVTVAFFCEPRAIDFQEFCDNGWEFLTISKEKSMLKYINYFEVTFKRYDFSATKPEKVEV